MALNPADGTSALQVGSADQVTKDAHQQSQIFPEDSATTKAEKVERQEASTLPSSDGQRSPKRQKTNGATSGTEAGPNSRPLDSKTKGVAQIKAEYLIHFDGRPQSAADVHDDDAAEASGKRDDRDRDGGSGRGGRGGKRQKGERGQNKARKFGRASDEIRLCTSRAHSNEFSAPPCPFGDKCRFEHDIRKYLKEGKLEDLDTLGGRCPVIELRQICPAGWKCRFVKTHSKEIEREVGRKEMVLLNAAGVVQTAGVTDPEDDIGPGVVNAVSPASKTQLRKREIKLPLSEEFNKWLDQRQSKIDKAYGEANGHREVADVRATYTESPLRPSEKRRIYYGPETPVLAPLTTQGNLPFRRLCVSLGAQITWSEMAMSAPLLQGEKQEWALLKAHESELQSPRYSPKSLLADYDNAADIRFGAQISANKPHLATKTVETLTQLCPSLRAIDLNSGCPIDLVYRTGAGCALMENPGRLEKILRGMNTVSGSVPITVKIRTGVKDGVATADKLLQRLVLGGGEAQSVGEGPAGVAAVTLHGRSRQQRYQRSANWEYIAECAALLGNLQSERDGRADTVREPDARNLAPNKVFFLGNGDVYSHVDYNAHIEGAGVDGVMVGRGALIKPWIFEEIEQGAYLDKSSSERLGYIERFVRNGLEYWGSDEQGVGTTRRFLLEWLSFACRYVPLGLLEVLPPRMGDRPPAFRGRDELETLLSSSNYKDWIKISEMFLGPTHKDFQFQPKHKSNSYEIEAEG